MKLTVCCVVTDDTFYLRMMVASISKIADELVVIDGSQNDDNKKMLKEFEKEPIKIIHKFDDFKNNFGRARQKAFNAANGEWVLWLDADEVLHEKEAPKLKKIIKEMENKGIDAAHLEYIHFIENFSKIDNSEPIHIGLLRLHKNKKGVKLNYRKNHALPKYNWNNIAVLIEPKIWHLGYLRGMKKIRERFMRNFHESEIHIPLHQKRWRDWHYYGQYPTRLINPEIIPRIIKETYGMLL